VETKKTTREKCPALPSFVNLHTKANFFQLSMIIVSKKADSLDGAQAACEFVNTDEVNGEVHDEGERSDRWSIN
jgi:hypothetical protein